MCFIFLRVINQFRFRFTNFFRGAEQEDAASLLRRLSLYLFKLWLWNFGCCIMVGDKTDFRAYLVNFRPTAIIPLSPSSGRSTWEWHASNTKKHNGMKWNSPVFWNQKHGQGVDRNCKEYAVVINYTWTSWALLSQRVLRPDMRLAKFGHRKHCVRRANILKGCPSVSTPVVNQANKHEIVN